MKSTDKILDAIEILIEKRLEKLRLTYMFKSTIYAVNSDGTYSIVKDKIRYNVKNGMGINFSVGKNVWIIVPNGELKDMFICGVR